jgi:ribosomal protein L7/L12
MTDAERLTQQVRLLAAGLGIDGAVDPEDVVPADVLQLASEGHAMKAIRQLRKARRLGLLEAKRIVDAIPAGGGVDGG